MQRSEKLPYGIYAIVKPVSYKLRDIIKDHARMHEYVRLWSQSSQP